MVLVISFEPKNYKKVMCKLCNKRFARWQVRRPDLKIHLKVCEKCKGEAFERLSKIKVEA
jgi:NAD-dependent SIR2 family protein deacetylase